MNFTPEEMEWIKENSKRFKIGDLCQEMNERYKGYVWQKSLRLEEIEDRVRFDFKSHGSEKVLFLNGSFCNQ